MKSGRSYASQSGLFHWLHESMQTWRRALKSPKMLWGFRDSSGTWRSRTRISDTVFFNHRDRIRIADNVFVWHYSILDGTGGLEIEQGVQIGAWVGVFTHSSHIAIRIYGNHYQEVPEAAKAGYVVQGVKIGRCAFIGAGAKILPGVTIGQGALIAAGSIVNRNVDDYQIVSGNPAAVIGDTRSLDKRFLRDEQLKEWYAEWQES